MFWLCVFKYSFEVILKVNLLCIMSEKTLIDEFPKVYKAKNLRRPYKTQARMNNLYRRKMARYKTICQLGSIYRWPLKKSFLGRVLIKSRLYKGVYTKLFYRPARRLLVQAYWAGDPKMTNIGRPYWRAQLTFRRLPAWNSYNSALRLQEWIFRPLKPLVSKFDYFVLSSTSKNRETDKVILKLSSLYKTSLARCIKNSKLVQKHSHLTSTIIYNRLWDKLDLTNEIFGSIQTSEWVRRRILNIAIAKLPETPRDQIVKRLKHRQWWEPLTDLDNWKRAWSSFRENILARYDYVPNYSDSNRMAEILQNKFPPINSSLANELFLKKTVLYQNTDLFSQFKKRMIPWNKFMSHKAIKHRFNVTADVQEVLLLATLLAINYQKALRAGSTATLRFPNRVLQPVRRYRAPIISWLDISAAIIHLKPHFVTRQPYRFEKELLKVHFEEDHRTLAQFPKWVWGPIAMFLRSDFRKREIKYNQLYNKAVQLQKNPWYKKVFRKIIRLGKRDLIPRQIQVPTIRNILLQEPITFREDLMNKKKNRIYLQDELEKFVEFPLPLLSKHLFWYKRTQPLSICYDTEQLWQRNWLNPYKRGIRAKKRLYIAYAKQKHWQLWRYKTAIKQSYIQANPFFEGSLYNYLNTFNRKSNPCNLFELLNRCFLTPSSYMFLRSLGISYFHPKVYYIFRESIWHGVKINHKSIPVSYKLQSLAKFNELKDWKNDWLKLPQSINLIELAEQNLTRLSPTWYQSRIASSIYFNSITYKDLLVHLAANRAPKIFLLNPNLFEAEQFLERFAIKIMTKDTISFLQDTKVYNFSALDFIPHISQKLPHMIKAPDGKAPDEKLGPETLKGKRKVSKIDRTWKELTLRTLATRPKFFANKMIKNLLIIQDGHALLKSWQFISQTQLAKDGRFSEWKVTNPEVIKNILKINFNANMPIIFTMTPKQYETWLVKRPQFFTDHEVIRMAPLSKTRILQILESERHAYENEYQTRFSPVLLVHIVNRCKKYFPADSSLLSSARRFLNLVCSEGQIEYFNSINLQFRRFKQNVLEELRWKSFNLKWTDNNPWTGAEFELGWTRISGFLDKQESSFRKSAEKYRAFKSYYYSKLRLQPWKIRPLQDSSTLREYRADVIFPYGKQFDRATDYERGTVSPPISPKWLRPADIDSEFELDPDLCDRVLCYMLDLRPSQLTSIRNANVESIASYLNQQVKGQPRAVMSVIDVVKRSKLRGKGTKPLGIFFFAGPTGVGKTELAKALSQGLYNSTSSFLRFDMSEFSQGHTSQRLIGAPPGYVGYGKDGDLTGPVKKNPNMVILFDEYEKAHSSISDLFLQLFDDGRLTDGKGETVNFTNCILILTSNIGYDIETSIKETETDTMSDELYEKTVQRVRTKMAEQFRPEFINRIDSIIVFRNLGKKELHDILSKILIKLNKKIHTLYPGLDIYIDPNARDLLIQAGFRPGFGARPLQRTISRMIETPLMIVLNTFDKRFSADCIFYINTTNGQFSMKFAKQGSYIYHEKKDTLDMFLSPLKPKKTS
uniref:Clp protease ATP binding subunit n=1 Tax=Chromera velia TaxID=505693 RepID=D9IXK6_9ALVE|nr:Clp protease ATP binding subunit [Chromera velia]ADJ66534.2 Clp protease ATP binding subunit [Chromera velia]